MKNKKNAITVAFLTFALTLFLNGRTEYIDTTLEEVYENFTAYQYSSEQFLKEPREEKLEQVFSVSDKFYHSYRKLNSHQTFYNQVFQRGPILSKNERLQLKEFANEHERMNDEIVMGAVEKLYKAKNILPFLEIAKDTGYFSNEHFTIIYDTQKYDISINGVFNISEEESKLSRRVFFITTNKYLYYLERPKGNWSSTYNENTFEIKEGNTVYFISAFNIKHDFSFVQE
jgi:hypothetical protein